MAPPPSAPPPPPPYQQHLPAELMEEILARMPVKSVLRCRCLSRGWAAALSSEAFVDRHLELANSRRRFPHLCLLPPSASASTVLPWSPEEGACCFVPPMEVPRSSGTLAATATRPCRGLLLLRSVAARLYYICNPAIGQIVRLPDGRMVGPRCPGRDYATFGLGYDARAGAHKVVRLLYHDARPAACDVYDVAGAAGHWRPAASGALPPPERVRMNELGVFVQGHLHWTTIGGEGEAIVSFSMASEEFGRVAPPPGVRVVEGPRLTELGGCLCLFSAPQSPHSPLRTVTIWLLTDYAATAWEKHWRIHLTMPAPEVSGSGGGFFSMLDGVTPLAVAEGGRRILFVSQKGQVAAYCLATGILEELVPAPAVGIIVPYEESLVPAGRPFEDVLLSPPPARALSMALSRLPARTLGHLKLVCRSWRAIIESDRFAASHKAHAMATGPVHVVFLDPFGTTVPAPVELLELFSSPVVSLPSSCSSASGGQNMNPPLSTTRVVCRKACHGLVLLSHQHSSVCALCNPVTRDVRTLRFFSAGQGQGCAGLGYDQSREEHVLVRIISCSETTRDEIALAAMECQVWPLRDLRHRTLPSPPPIPVAVDVPPVHVAGKMYWPGAAPPAAAILAFDISTKTFDVVPAPPVPHLDVDDGDRIIVLAELDGKLCAAHTSRSTETVTVWSKDDDGCDDAGGWRMAYAMRLGQWPEFSPRSAELVVPVAVDPRDGRVLLDTGKALGYYDACTRSLETVYSLRSSKRYRTPADDLFFIAAVCEDTLFRPYDTSCRIW